jgi:hypothetical protein
MTNAQSRMTKSRASVDSQQVGGGVHWSLDFSHSLVIASLVIGHYLGGVMFLFNVPELVQYARPA